jgi:hypothetical protein
MSDSSSSPDQQLAVIERAVWLLTAWRDRDSPNRDEWLQAELTRNVGFSTDLDVIGNDFGLLIGGLLNLSSILLDQLAGTLEVSGGDVLAAVHRVAEKMKDNPEG